MARLYSAVRSLTSRLHCPCAMPAAGEGRPEARLTTTGHWASNLVSTEISGGIIMREERTFTAVGRLPIRGLSWPAIFGGVFFALGIMFLLSMFGVAVGAASAGPQGATSGVATWSGIWSLVTVFFGFLAGAWLAAKASSTTSADGRLHGLVTWG